MERWRPESHLGEAGVCAQGHNRPRLRTPAVSVLSQGQMDQWPERGGGSLSSVSLRVAF